MEEAFTYALTTQDIEISVAPRYVPERSNPEGHYFFYAYTVKIHNHSVETCQLVSRSWLIRDGSGKEEVVQGEGVVGEKPIISPGECFEYTSACPLRTQTGNMRGHYVMVDEKGQRFNVVIPVFFLRPPATFH